MFIKTKTSSFHTTILFPLVSELVSKEHRGICTSIIASVGLCVANLLWLAGGISNR